LRPWCRPPRSGSTTRNAATCRRSRNWRRSRSCSGPHRRRWRCYAGPSTRRARPRNQRRGGPASPRQWPRLTAEWWGVTATGFLGEGGVLAAALPVGSPPRGAQARTAEGRLQWHGPSLLETLLVERATATWLQPQYADAAYAQAEANSSSAQHQSI